MTQANVDAMRKSASLDIRRLFGTEGDSGTGLGLWPDWACQMIKSVGRYGEIFERNVGAGSELTIDRGQNALWSKDGLQYAPPIRQSPIREPTSSADRPRPAAAFCAAGLGRHPFPSSGNPVRSRPMPADAEFAVTGSRE